MDYNFDNDIKLGKQLRVNSEKHNVSTSGSNDLLSLLWPDFLAWVNNYVGDSKTAALASYSREDMRYAYEAGFNAAKDETKR